jgi:Fe-S cluster assembly ATP-binding protein
MLRIENLHARVEEKEILKGFNLTVNAGEVHAIMGPNGAGKSTLASVLAGNSNFEVTTGSALLDGVDLLEMAPEERAREGVFLAFQYPVEIPGVSNTNFLRAALGEVRKHRGMPELDAKAFLAYIKEKKEMVETDC